MAYLAGNKRNDAGLVLQIDPANIKCFRGEPTTNILSALYPYLDSATNWINSGNAIFNTNEIDAEKPSIPNADITDIRIISARITQSPCNIHVGPAYVPVNTLTIGTTYSISIWFRQNKAGAIGSAQMRTIDNQFLSPFTYNGSNNTSIWPVNKWIKIIATNIYPVGGNGGLYLSSYMGGSVGDKVWYFAPQLEAKDHSTHFVNGARGTTIATSGGFIDLSKSNNNAELKNNLLYKPDNAGCLLFDSTDSHILLQNATLSSIVNGTISFWSKMIDNSNWLIMSGDTTSYYLLATTGVDAFYNSNCGSPTVYVDGILNNNPPTDLKWHNITATNVNLSSWNTFSLGVYFSSGYKYNGYIGQILFYNRVLSQQEIQNIYNSTKSRYI